MSNHLGVKATLELLDTLKSVVREVAAREEQLSAEFRARSAKLRQRLDWALGEQNARLSAETAALDSTFRSDQVKVASRFDRRAAHVGQAHKNAAKRRLDKIAGEEGRLRYEVQRDLLQTNRDRDESVQRAEESLAAFNTELAQAQEALGVLERRADRSFRGYGRFRRWLSAPSETFKAELSAPSPADEHLTLEQLRALIGKTRGQLGGFWRFLAPLFFQFVTLRWLIPLILMVHVALVFVPILQQFGISSFSYHAAAISALACLGGVMLLHFIGGRLAGPAAHEIAAALAQARQLHEVCTRQSAARHTQELERIKNEHEARTQKLHRQWQEAVEAAITGRESAGKNLDAKASRVAGKIDALRRKQLEQLERERSGQVENLNKEVEIQRSLREVAHATEGTQISAEHEAQMQKLVAEWERRIKQIHEAITAARATAERIFPNWNSTWCEKWEPPQEFAHAAKFARLDVDVAQLAGSLPQEPRLAFPGPTQFEMPLLLTIPDQSSVLFETKESGREDAIAALNNIMLRLLATTPPGKLSFTIIDPVELGQNFAGVMHLADYESRLINDRIWTQSGQIEQKLADLNEHIEKVTQMYLRNEYQTITEYNEQAGRIAEKYHFLVVADFPVNFSDVAARRLLSIATSGARCGVYMLIHWDQRRPLPHDFVAALLAGNSVCLRRKGDEFMAGDKPIVGAKLVLDSPPEPDLATAFLHKVGRSSIDSNRVEMPFAEIAPDELELWSLDTTNELRVPIGRTGATKLQYLALGKGTRQHALIAGKTGSGKSTLFHVMITNLALWASPEQVEFYLVDFKKGVEFKCYATAHLPHARVIAIESDREFGLSVLQRVDEELRRRGDLFRQLGVQDVVGYKRSGGTEPIPRTLLIIDEFQEFFVEDDRVSQGAALLLDRIVRQGRAFGIHVLLGSQTLGGAYTLARATLGQMVVRVALQCNEADAYLIMDDENPAPRLLSRPGEAIYNDTAGTIEGNSPFQIVWLPDEEREVQLEKVRQRADAASTSYPNPIVFEGNAPADVGENSVLEKLLAAEAIQPATAARAWLGAPNSIKGPTEAVFHRQSGNNLLIVGQRDEAVLAMLTVSLVSLTAQHPRGTARFIVFDCTPPSASREYLERLKQSIPHDFRLANNADIDELMTGLASEMARRADPEQAASAPATYLFVHGIQRFKKLRYEEDFEFSLDADKSVPAGSQLNKLITEGTSLGFHVICTCDTANNVSRFLSRKAVSEFEMRVLFQMSATDSASLIETPKAGNLGLHRAIFFNGHEGYLETFRPYALPNQDWMQAAARSLNRLLGA